MNKSEESPNGVRIEYKDLEHADIHTDKGLYRVSALLYRTPTIKHNDK